MAMSRQKTPEPIYASVPRLLRDGGTVLVLGCGPSLNRADVELVASSVDITIAVNDSYILAPHADVLYAADGQWWKWHQGAAAHKTATGKDYPAFTGQLKYSLARTGYKDVQILRKGLEVGLSLDPSTVALGRNSVYQAINVAVHLGATRILLLGVDMQDGPRHFFGRHPNNSGPPVEVCKQRFETMVEPLKKAGVEVLNCSRQTALKAFPCVRLEDALRRDMRRTA